MNISHIVSENKQFEYSIFGVSLICEYPLQNNCILQNEIGETVESDKVVNFSRIEKSPFPVDWETGELKHSRKYTSEQGEVWNRFYHFNNFDLLMFGWGADFYIYENQITCHLPDTRNEELMELFLLGPVLAFWLEKQGRLVLHPLRSCCWGLWGGCIPSSQRTWEEYTSIWIFKRWGCLTNR